MPEENATFESLNTRLDEILNEVDSADISLDDALSLYEEAIKIGLKACDLSELGLEDAEEEQIDFDSESSTYVNSATDFIVEESTNEMSHEDESTNEAPVVIETFEDEIELMPEEGI